MRDKVDIWRASLREESRWLDRHWRRLDRAERTKSERFGRKEDRERYIIARSTLRAVLSRTLGLRPSEIKLGRNARGKPILLDSPRRESFHLSTSHSGNWILHGVSRDGRVGVDVEAVHSTLCRLATFEGVLSAEEIAGIEALPPSKRPRALATAWVRKEAYVKAQGEGLCRAPENISIAQCADGRPILLHDRNPAADASPWVFEDLALDDAHAACVVVGAPAATVRMRVYSSCLNWWASITAWLFCRIDALSSAMLELQVAEFAII